MQHLASSSAQGTMTYPPPPAEEDDEEEKPGDAFTGTLQHGKRQVGLQQMDGSGERLRQQAAGPTAGHWFVQGHGVYKWANGAVYEGDYVDGKKHGDGKMVYPDKGCYEGKRGGELHRAAIWFRPACSMAAAWFSTAALGCCSQQQCPALPACSISDMAAGVLKGARRLHMMSHRSGQAIHTRTCCCCALAGAWSEDKQHGEGSYTYPNGDTYVGAWEAGKKHGAGCYHFAAQQCQFIGTFDAGARVPCPHVPPCPLACWAHTEQHVADRVLGMRMAPASCRTCVWGMAHEHSRFRIRADGLCSRMPPPPAPPARLQAHSRRASGCSVTAASSRAPLMHPCR